MKVHFISYSAVFTSKSYYINLRELYSINTSSHAKFPI